MEICESCGDILPCRCQPLIVDRSWIDPSPAALDTPTPGDTDG